MGELRQNIATGEWVVVAPERGERPLDESVRDAAARRPRYVPDCPFCPGNERRLAGIHWELPLEPPGMTGERALERPDVPEGIDSGRSAGGGEDERPGWMTRAVPNLYPAFAERAECTDSLQPDRGIVFPASGRQEVLVETPRHDLDPSRLSCEALCALARSYHARYVHLSGVSGIQRVFLFRNHGRDAGISLVHPHSQLVATTFTPPLVRAREDRLREFHRDHGKCLLCGIQSAWEEGGPRLAVAGEGHIVREGRQFVAFVPWAAETSFEVWIVPRRHTADFSASTPEELTDLGEILGQLLRALRAGAGDPPYNLVLYSSGRLGKDRPELHWYFRILPRTTQRAGFEIGAGIPINPSAPEVDAAVLREAIEEDSR